MSNSTNRTTRWTAPSPKRPVEVLTASLRRPDVWTRVALCTITALILWLVTGAWAPSFPYRARQAPLHHLHARASFQYYDDIETRRAQERARRTALCYYSNDEKAINELRQALVDRIFQIKDKPWEEVERDAWNEFLGEKFEADPIDAPQPHPDEVPSDGEQDQTPADDASESQDIQIDPAQRAFERFTSAIKDDTSLEALKLGLETAMLNITRTGLLKNLEHEFGEGSTQQIMVYPLGSDPGSSSSAQLVDVSQVRIGEIAEELHSRLRTSLDNQESIVDPRYVADRLYDWLREQLPTTLKLDKAATERSMRNAERRTEKVYKLYSPGSPLEKRNLSASDASVISAGRPLDQEDIALLQAEHRAFVRSMSLMGRIFFTLANWGMYFAVFSLLCGYLYYRDRTLIDDLRQFALLLGLFMVTVITAWILSINVNWRAEIIPICMFAMTIAIAYHRELALLLSALAALVFTISHGFGMTEFVVLTATAFVASLLCGRIRSRTRLVYIGLISAAVAFPTTIGIGTIAGQPLGAALFLDGAWFAGGALLSGLFMTALLPFLEQWFGIQTDISLLELSDANHPLLKQLVQRAPGTYNHSINVASISEAAAEAIGANGLLCRVAAYFHDIGKMRKPEYFIENQGIEGNKHDDLVPTMSTLVIIAHVKDGAEMGRKNHLPQRIINIIEQHHGTTLVEYFYRQATRKQEESADAHEIEEADFRYPGPKPQSQEAAVVMLADSVESASRTLREPTPARIENLVENISKKKLDDGQFDQCSLTLQQLRIIEKSLIKSLNAMYHARVKYPDQQLPA
jgi:putative nucleotidyltransferase with HDIG domain